MLTRQVSLIVPRKAFARLIQRAEGVVFFDDLYVAPRFRRRGYASELILFALEYLDTFPEMDIRHSSRAVQRIARRLGYKKLGPSNRYAGCALWIPGRGPAKVPQSRFAPANCVDYKRVDGVTQVLYLRLV